MADGALRPAERARAWLLSQWFRPGRGLFARLMAPWAWLYGGLQARFRQGRQRQAHERQQPHGPVLVVGNLVLGGAGKTPTTVAIVQALQAAGRKPGVVSRGYGRQGDEVLAVSVGADPARVGDEPLLIHRRTGAPVVVGRDRVAAALHLQAAHPEVDLIVADDGLQHRQLRRDVEVVVFDERGIGNGCLLPAGPLREPLPANPEPAMLVLYNHGHATTHWPGHCLQRRLGPAWPLADWLAGHRGRERPLAALQGRPLLAMAGIAVPERFFLGLEAAGLQIERLALPDHHAYDQPPWPAGTRELVTTEKDAVKLARWADGAVAIWVVGLDLVLPAEVEAELMQRLRAAHRS